MSKALWLGLLGAVAIQCGVASAETPPADAQPRIQVAVLLDTSNSMDGLINQARTQLWKIVNEFTTIKLGGKQPKLEVALYEYGNDGLPAAEHHLRMVVPFTGDLDKISEAMFALKTNGGNEFCGRVIDAATRQLTWSGSHKDVKCIFIAGNEPFDQGDFPYEKACKEAAAKGITVNTIFCGDAAEGVQTFWQRGSQLADGSYMSINQNQQVATAPAPQDKELAKLSAELSKTYLPYGDTKMQSESLGRQVAQDQNAVQSAPSSAAARASFKASAQYKNTEWDLVDGLSEGKVKLEELKDEQLPEPLRELKPAQRKEFVERAAAKRKEIQASIQKLSEDRKVYLADQEKKMRAQAAAARPAGSVAGSPALAAPAEASFDRAVIDAVQRAAAEK